MTTDHHDLDAEIETTVLMLDPVVQDIVARTITTSDRFVNTPEFRCAAQEVASRRGVAVTRASALFEAITRLRQLNGHPTSPISPHPQ